MYNARFFRYAFSFVSVLLRPYSGAQNIEWNSIMDQEMQGYLTAYYAIPNCIVRVKDEPVDDELHSRSKVILIKMISDLLIML